jgi:hypothetical protein
MNQSINKDELILSAVKFVGITFDPDSYKKGQDEFNGAIKDGYKIVCDYQTSTGVVYSMGLYKKDTEALQSSNKEITNE